jgi:hypothetical protein
MSIYLNLHGSSAAYRQLLTLVIAGKEYDLWELGRFIGCIHASMDSFHRDDAEFDLARLDAKRPRRASLVVGAKAQTAVDGQEIDEVAKGNRDTKPTNSSGG